MGNGLLGLFILNRYTLQGFKDKREGNSHVSVEAILQQIAGEAEQGGAGAILAMASEGIAAFQHAYSLGKPLSSTTYASLLSILDSANAWELAPQIYEHYPAQVEFAAPWHAISPNWKVLLLMDSLFGMK